MSNLKESLIRLGARQPRLRKDIRPILAALGDIRGRQRKVAIREKEIEQVMKRATRQRVARVTEDQVQALTDKYEPIPEAEARRIADRINRGSDPHSILQDVNEIVDGFGVEAIRDHDAYDPYWGKIVAEYINMGDMYWPTLWYDVYLDEFTITDWATYMRELESRYDNLTQR